MATQKIRYDIEAAVTGGNNVKTLATSLEGLANTLEGDLKVQALASAAALRQLGEKQGAIDSFKKLKVEAQDAANRLKEAQTAAQQLGQSLSGTAGPTRAQAGELQKLRDTVRAAKAEVIAKTAALDQSRGALRTYGISTTNVAEAERNVRAALAATGAEVRRLAPGWAAAGQAAAASGQQQARAAADAKSGLQGLGDQLRNIQNIAIAALGGGFVGGLVKDLGKTADAYTNLTARLKLATGEGKAFEGALADVTRVALATNTSIETTATLFGRLAAAGKSAGQSAAVAQEAALGITETINQAVIVSGASAQSGNAAITQLIQGLQSGVLRGEEFNSVMEQAPRLANAMADGLGVTTGELRKMANQGQLTTEVVIGALKSQAETLRAEYASMPLTIGAAIQNLSTSWLVYVGETDQATGASRTAAEAIGALATNLKTVADLLLDVGQAGAAFVALRLAQSFLGLGAAAVVGTTAVAGTAAALGTAGVAGTAAAVGVSRFALALRAIPLFALVAIVANFKDIGTWIGEGIAKLQGYKDKTKELEDAEKSRLATAKEQRAITEAQGLANKAATDAQFGLTKAAQASLFEFDKLTKSGKSAADAIKDIGKDFDLAKSAGIRDAVTVLDKLAADGKLTAEEFRKAWADALKGEDLLQFEVRFKSAMLQMQADADKAAQAVGDAIAKGVDGKELQTLKDKAQVAFSAVQREAERTAQVMDATLAEAVRRTGLDMNLISGGMGKAATSALNDVDRIVQGLDQLKTQGVDVGQVLQASLTKALNTADGQKALDEVKARIEAVRTALGNKVADGLLDQAKAKADALKESLDKVKPGINGVEEAMRRLGIISDESIKKTAAEFKASYDEMAADGKRSARELGEAFKKSADSAIAANNGIAPSWVVGEAAARGYKLEVDEAGKTTVRAMNEAADATRGAGKAADGAAGSYGRMGQSAAQAAEAVQKLAAINAKYARPGEGAKPGQGGSFDPGRGSIYSRPGQNPVNGNGQTQAEFQREQKLKGQGAQDLSLQFSLLDKLQKGTLTADDVGSLKGVVEALKENEKMLARIPPGLNSLQALADDRKWGNARIGFQNAIRDLERAPGPPGTLPPGASGSRSVVVELRNGNATERITTDESGAAALVRSLKNASLVANG